MAKALSGYEEALSIYRKLAVKNLDAYLPDVGVALNNLASLQKDNNEMTKALSNYEEALNIYRELAVKNPSVYLSNIASTLNGLTGLYHADYYI